jgi:ribosomal protein L40E
MAAYYAVPMSWLTLGVVAALVIAGALLIITALQHRRHASESDVRMCPGCATPNPTHAEFCRKCGKRLKPE